MAEIFITSTCKETNYNLNPFANLERVIRWSSLDTKKLHNIVDCPDRAELILFVDDRRHYHSGIYTSKIFRQHRHKSLVIDFADLTIPRIPGIYANIPKYLHQYPIYEFLFYDHGGFDPDIAKPLFANYKYLFSFMGSVSTYPSARSKILELQHSRAYLQDTVTYSAQELYCDVMTNSKFVLCPRGLSPSSIRLFETMKAGRVPVIISDEWREIDIDGNWQDFAIRVSERDIGSIPALLETLEPKAIEMGKKASIAWEKNFSLQNAFHWLVETCLRIHHSRADYERVASRSLYLEVLGTHHFFPFWREVARSVTNNI